MNAYPDDFQNFAPTLSEQVKRATTDDECVARLAYAVEEHDDHKLTEVALLISRLAVPIE